VAVKKEEPIQGQASNNRSVVETTQNPIDDQVLQGGETPRNTEIPKRKGPRKSIAGTMRSIEKNKRTLNVPLTGRLASVGGPKHLRILSDPEMHLIRDPSMKK
jgi:hypothetical protein